MIDIFIVRIKQKLILNLQYIFNLNNVSVCIINISQF